MKYITIKYYLYWILAHCILLVSTTVSDAQTAKGTVYNDLNKNSIMDRGEPGVAEVLVSNGIDVVLTDQNGLYQIEAPENSVIFVIKPSGYEFPVSENNIPQFYYLHYPNGSPKLHFEGVQKTGPLPKQINFALISASETDTFKAIFFGDTQPYSLTDIDYLSRDVIPELIGKDDYIFASVLGDIVGDNLSFFSPLTEAMALLEKPVYYVQGNHDMNYDVTDDRLASETYKAVFGPKNYAFNYGQVHFVVLDNIIYSGDTITKDYNEGFDEESVTFLKNDLSFVNKDKLIVLMMHAPFINENTQSGITNLDKILAELNKFPYTFSISGHNHTISQHLISDTYSWTQSKPHHHFNAGAACGDWWQGMLDEEGLPDATMRDGSPNGYTIVTFSGNTYIFDYKAARQPIGHQLNIFAPELIRKTENQYSWSNSYFYVNFFIGSKTDSVSFRVDNSNWKAMTYTIEPDPSYYNINMTWDNSTSLIAGRRPSWPEDCLHLWKARLPAYLSPGYHTIEVEAFDIFGRKHEGSFVYQIQE